MVQRHFIIIIYHLYRINVINVTFNHILIKYSNQITSEGQLKWQTKFVSSRKKKKLDIHIHIHIHIHLWIGMYLVKTFVAHQCTMLR